MSPLLPAAPKPFVSVSQPDSLQPQAGAGNSSASPAAAPQALAPRVHVGLIFLVKPHMLKFMEFLKMFPFCSFVPATSPPVYSSEGCQNNPFLSEQLTAQVINRNVTFPSLPSFLQKSRAMNSNNLHISVACTLCRLQTPAKSYTTNHEVVVLLLAMVTTLPCFGTSCSKASPGC